MSDRKFIDTAENYWAGLAQRQFHRIRAKMTLLAMGRMRRGLALVTAVVLAVRLHGNLPETIHGEKSAEMDLPSCCH